MQALYQLSYTPIVSAKIYKILQVKKFFLHLQSDWKDARVAEEARLESV